jgi:hypothetical protein
MCSTLDAIPAPVTVPGLARLVEHAVEAVRALADALVVDPTLLAEVPDELLETLTLQLHAARDASDAAATVVTGRLERVVGGVKGKLIAGTYASTSRFLEAEAGMAPGAARATVARGRDLCSHSTRVGDDWLAGRIKGGSIRALTLGVSDLLVRSSRSDTPLSRQEALDTLMPYAVAGDARRLELEVRELRLIHDPDGCAEEALFAFENQSLSIVENGALWRISGTLTPEVAAATLTVLDTAARSIATEQLGDLAHDPDCELALVPGSGCTCGELDRARRAAGLHPDQLRARALGEVMGDQLSRGELGTHHGVAPQLTIIADITDATAPLVGRMTIPGTDQPALLPDATMHRLLCDADITRVLTTTVPLPDRGAEGEDRDAQDHQGGYLSAVVSTLTAMARSVLYVGRSQRTVSARLRKALETRDGHCVFPGCRARVGRCHAHHVIPWEHGGPTTIDNLALLCVTHHHAVHEGGWTMHLRPGYTGHEQGCWTFTEPPLRRRPLRP